MDVEVRPYDAALANDWLKLLKQSRNGIFLYDRAFIEYHGCRFTDFSALAYMGGQPVALLPASIDKESGAATSHAGLTFGGFVFDRMLRGPAALAVIDETLRALKNWGASSLVLKILPYPFCKYPSGEADYGLWRNGFGVIRRDLSSLLYLRDPIPFNKSKIQSVKRARKEALVCVDISASAFYFLLEDVLRKKHGVTPVHSLAEMEMLIGRFPENIFLRGVMKDGAILAGIMIFNYGNIWHTQYMAASDDGRALGALDLIINEVIGEATRSNVDYLSFGVSTEDFGCTLNDGLLWQKESYGARSIVHEFMSGML